MRMEARGTEHTSGRTNKAMDMIRCLTTTPGHNTDRTMAVATGEIPMVAVDQVASAGPADHPANQGAEALGEADQADHLEDCQVEEQLQEI